MTQKITKEDQEVLKEIEEYWRLTIASAIFHASGKLAPATVQEAFEMCEKIARGKEDVWGD
jgi:hypothetical protein